MSRFKEYLAQETYGYNNDLNHYDQHTDKWGDEASESVYGHCDVHIDATY